jgi:peptidoglycan hydrolase-like protein with peptidoglycan-binding domain
VDSIAIIAAIAATLVIVINAMFLQSSMQTPPFFNAGSSSAKSDSLKPLITGSPVNPARPIANSPLPQPAPARRNDPITDLIGPSPRIAAVQRVLAEYGYGQIKVTGTLDNATSAAIAKFERDHNMPSSGRVSDRLIREITAMVGHPID